LVGGSAPLGGGLYCKNGSSPILENTIIAYSTQGEAVHCFDEYGQSQPALICCDVYGNAGGDWVGCIAGQLGVDGNISECPEFCDRFNDNFYLSESSPCVIGYGCGQIGVYGVGCTTGEASAVEETSWSSLKALYR
jgi:hypothetical protein